MFAIAARISYIPVENFKYRSVVGLRDPIQIDLDGSESKTISGDGWSAELYYLAKYDIVGMVVDPTRFDNKRGATAFDKMMPMDFGILYGYSAQHRNWFDFSHKRRTLIPKWRMTPNADEYNSGMINHTLTNNHIITDDADMRKRLYKVKEGEVVRIKGYLVSGNVYDTKTGRLDQGFASSLSRDDSNGLFQHKTTCEIIYITDLEILEKSPF